MFEILILTFLFLGIFSIFNRDLSLILFVGLSLVIPTSAAFGSFVYRNGLMVFDAFFLGLFLNFLINLFTRKTLVNKKLYIIFNIVALIFIAYLIISFYSQYNMEYVLKDIRPFLYLCQVFLLFYIYSSDFVKIENPWMFRFAFFASLTNVIYFSLLYVGYFKFNDVFYDVNIRYLDLSTYFSAFFIVYYTFLYRNIRYRSNYFVLILAIISVLISNSRFLLLSVMIASATILVVDFKSFLKVGFYSSIFIVLFVLFSSYVGQDRVLEGLNYDGAIVQILNRFSPGLTEIQNMNGIQYISGYGLGKFFVIPWFDYREINNLNVSIDSAYLTHYVKQGVFGIAFLFLVIYLLSNTPFPTLSRAYVVFWIILFFVSASLYQNYVFGSIFYLSLFRLKNA
ncbi:DUF6369 family protein [Algoriphagus resistens]|uniref:DUF6369 family protein n=1 Tax=Algoriphagus resistens TaxID=1750590 RepID=UPI000716AD1A|nr:DUF6369 family protein [Algoriphagus resistens]